MNLTAVLWSPTQQAFHTQPWTEYVQYNHDTYIVKKQKYSDGYVLVSICPDEAVDSVVNQMEKMLGRIDPLSYDFIVQPSTDK